MPEDKFYNPLPARIRFTKAGMHLAVAVINVLAAVSIAFQLKLWPVAVLNVLIALMQMRMFVWAVKL